MKKRYFALVLILAIVVILVLLIPYQLATVIKTAGRIIVRPIGPAPTPGPTPLDPEIRVFTDETRSTLLTFVDWGECFPGGSTTYDAYIFNAGSVPVALVLSTENWNPQEASDYLHLTWSYSNPLQAEKGVSVILKLSVDSDIHGVTHFFFDIVILYSRV